MSESKIKSVPPHPIDTEILFTPGEIVVSKANANGILEYVNEALIQVSAYDPSELIDQSQEIFKHPDMPGIIIKMQWEHFTGKKDFNAIIKNLAKTGEYYWVLADFSIRTTPDDKTVKLICRGTLVRQKDIDEAVVLYDKLTKIEKSAGLEFSRKFLVGYLEERGLTYKDFVNQFRNSKPLVSNSVSDHHSVDVQNDVGFFDVNRQKGFWDF